MIQTIEQINKQYNGNWVFLINCEVAENGDIVQGEVICHSKSREEVFRKMHECKNSDTMFSIRFAGEIPEGVSCRFQKV